jgi:hypothetical protein
MVLQDALLANTVVYAMACQQHDPADHPSGPPAVAKGASVRRYSRCGAKLLIQSEAFRVGDLFIGGHACHVRAGSPQCLPLLDISGFQIEVVLKCPPVVLRLVSG